MAIREGRPFVKDTFTPVLCIVFNGLMDGLIKYYYICEQIPGIPPPRSAPAAQESATQGLSLALSLSLSRARALSLSLFRAADQDTT